ncbi:hypothetical protein [Lyngbya aestuarii]|uniref:hypothetical protein n=1 Tax=Lyngbya aestuarii TaxID=118322 RepID=UPI00403D67FB
MLHLNHQLIKNHYGENRIEPPLRQAQEILRGCSEVGEIGASPDLSLTGLKRK